MAHVLVSAGSFMYCQLWVSLDEYLNIPVSVEEFEFSTEIQNKYLEGRYTHRARERPLK